MNHPAAKNLLKNEDLKPRTNILNPDKESHEHSGTDQKDYGDLDERPLGVNVVLKAFQNFPTYPGKLTEDLEEVIQTFETLADVWDVTSDNKNLDEINMILEEHNLENIPATKTGTPRITKPYNHDTHGPDIHRSLRDLSKK